MTFHRNIFMSFLVFFTQVPYFRDGDGASVLVRVLTAFSRLNPELGYVQVIASFLLLSCVLFLSLLFNTSDPPFH